jgi:dTMP kinase
MSKGLLIIFDGPDGVGKTTQIKLAQEALEADGRPVVVSRNLGGTRIGEALRDVMLSKIERPEIVNLYISVAIQEALIQDTKARKASGKIVLMDRGPFSLAAYEAYGSGLDKELVWPYVDEGIKGLEPDLTILNESDIGLALKRLKRDGRKADYFESKPRDFFERVVAGYQEAAKRYPVSKVDASGSVQEVHQVTMKLILAALKA